MLTKIISLIIAAPKFSSFIFGSLLSTSLAPLFFWPMLVTIGLFAYQIRNAESFKNAFWIGYWFGFGFFLFGLYWISIGVSVYSQEFWWAIPISLCGLPAFLAFYFAFFGSIAHFFSSRSFYLNSFACLWIVFEIMRTYLFTGFPWNLIGYSFAFSDVVIQLASLIGIYGIGLIVVFSFSLIYYLMEKLYIKFSICFIICLLVWYSIFYFGNNRLGLNPTEYTNTKMRLIQPSIPQTEKWTEDLFWGNFNIHKDLSLENLSPANNKATSPNHFSPDFIIWPESAVVAPLRYANIYNAVKSVAYSSNSVLITGGITDNYFKEQKLKDEIYPSIYAIDPDGKILFKYHKSHLVPFGEYVPLSSILPIAKLTPGDMPYSSGAVGFIAKLPKYNIDIRPLLCYEIIFPSEVLMDNSKVDLLLNLTNDGYYGDSSGPYQHFYMSRLRAVESGLPLIRVANNGISGIIDAVGRILIKTKINDRTYIDTHLPSNLKKPTPYFIYKEKFLYLYILCSLIMAILLRTNKNSNQL